MRKLIALLLCCGVGFLMSCRQQTTADDVVDMMTEARGGAEALAAWTDHVATGEITLHVMPPGTPEGVGPMTLPVIFTAKRPNKVRWDVYGPGGSIATSLCYDGTTGWVMEMGHRKDLTEAQLQDFESMAFFDGLFNYQDKGFTLELLADEVADEQNYRVLQVTDKHDNVKKQYINPETHFLERVSGNVPNSAGEWERRAGGKGTTEPRPGISALFDIELSQAEVPRRRQKKVGGLAVALTRRQRLHLSSRVECR